MRLPIAMVGAMLMSAVAAAQDGGVPVSPGVAKAIRALRSAKPAERIDAAKRLSRQSSDVVPALLPWSWGCGEGTLRDGAVEGADCARINEATYHVLGVLSAIARKEPADCEPDCPARMALFGLTTYQGGTDWDRLPLEDDDSRLPAAVRGPALRAYGIVQFREGFALPDWPDSTTKPVGRFGGTKVYVVTSTTHSSFYMDCALAVYEENERGRVGKLVARDAKSFGIGCLVEKVEAAAVAEAPGAIAVAVTWQPMGGADPIEDLYLLQPEKGQLKVVCSTEGDPGMLAHRADLLRIGPRGCVLVKGLGRNTEGSTSPK